jgi:uncharacterized membrane protein YdjX (TVP38/TMEM64 family)
MTETVEKKDSPIWIKLWPVYVIAAGLALAISQGWHQYLTLDSLSNNAVWLDELVKNNLLLVFGLYILIYAAATTFIIPGGVLTIAGGFLFGLYIGTPATLIGATLGASILFFAAKTSIGSVLRQIAGPFLERMEKGFNENALSYMFALRLIPLFPFAVVNIATFFGIIPGTLAYTWIGAAIKGTLLEGGEVDIGSLAANFLPAFIALGVVSLIPVAYKKITGRKTDSAEA